MTNAKIAGVFSLFVLSVCAGKVLWRFNDQPSLKVLTPSVSFGLVRPGESETMPIRIANIGHAPLLITELSTSCTCSGVSLTKDILPPGETAEIRVTVKGGSKPRSLAFVTFSTNDRKHSRVDVPVEFQSRTGVWTDKETVSFGAFESAGNDNLRVIRIEGETPVSNTDLQFSTSDSFRQAFDFSASNATIQGQVHLSVWVRDTAPCGFIDGRLEIKHAKSSASVYVNGYQESKFAKLVRPVCLELQTEKNELYGTGYIILRDHSSSKKSLHAECSNEMVAVNTAMRNNTLRLELHCNSERLIDAWDDDICVLVRDDDHDEILRVPVYFDSSGLKNGAIVR